MYDGQYMNKPTAKVQSLSDVDKYKLIMVQGVDYLMATFHIVNGKVTHTKCKPYNQVFDISSWRNYLVETTFLQDLSFDNLRAWSCVGNLRNQTSFGVKEELVFTEE